MDKKVMNQKIKHLKEDLERIEAVIADTIIKIQDETNKGSVDELEDSDKKW